jgi:hypothetical protein
MQAETAVPDFTTASFKPFDVQLSAPRSALAAQVRASRVAWASNPTEIAETISALGRRALARSGGDGARAETIFEDYLSRVSNRLENAGSRLAWSGSPLR